MKFKEYIEESARTDKDLGDNNRLHWLLGIKNEFGEALGPIKKALVKDVEVDKAKLQDELVGDCSWYLAKGMRLNNFKLPDTYAYHEVDNILDVIAVFDHYWKTEDLMGMWCALMNVATIYDLDVEKGLANNIAKLKVRHPNGFDINNKKHTKDEQEAIK